MSWYRRRTRSRSNSWRYRHRREKDVTTCTQINEKDLTQFKENKNITDAHLAAAKACDDFNLELKRIGQLLVTYPGEDAQNPESPHFTLRWGTRERITRSLKLRLWLYQRWLHIRSLFREAAERMYSLKVAMSSAHTIPYPSSMKCSIGCDPQYLHAADFEADGYPTKQYDECMHLCVRYRKLCREADMYYAQCRALCVLPEMKHIRKKLPVHGFMAYAVLKVCETGCITDNKPEENCLFGWYHDDGHRRGTRVHQCLRVLMRGMNPRIPENEEKIAGRTPSLRLGRSWFEHTWEHDRVWKEKTVDINSNQTSRQYRHAFLRSKVSQEIWNALLCGSTDAVGISMTKYVYDQYRLPSIWNPEPDHGRKHRVWNKLCYKIMGVTVTEDGVVSNPRSGIRNEVATIIIDSPTRLRGDDYVAPCLYATRRSSWRDAAPDTTRGWVYFRRGWNDMYHSSTELTPEQAFIHLETASNHHFATLRDAAERNKTREQRIAGLLRQLRKIPNLTREDSYAASNCQPGTENFINRLKLLSKDPQRKEVDGKELAICWRKSEYVEEMRFGNVIRLLTKRNEVRLAAEAKLADPAYQAELARQDDELLRELKAPVPVPVPEVPPSEAEEAVAVLDSQASEQASEQANAQADQVIQEVAAYFQEDDSKNESNNESNQVSVLEDGTVLADMTLPVAAHFQN